MKVFTRKCEQFHSVPPTIFRIHLVMRSTSSMTTSSSCVPLFELHKYCPFYLNPSPPLFLLVYPFLPPEMKIHLSSKASIFEKREKKKERKLLNSGNAKNPAVSEFIRCPLQTRFSDKRRRADIDLVIADSSALNGCSLRREGIDETTCPWSPNPRGSCGTDEAHGSHVSHSMTRPLFV